MPSPRSADHQSNAFRLGRVFATEPGIEYKNGGRVQGGGNAAHGPGAETRRGQVKYGPHLCREVWLQNLTMPQTVLFSKGGLPFPVIQE